MKNSHHGLGMLLATTERIYGHIGAIFRLSGTDTRFIPGVIFHLQQTENKGLVELFSVRHGRWVDL